MKNISIPKPVILLSLAFATFTANAWDGSPTGTISSIDVTSGSNQAVRVYLSGISSMCTDGAGWAYLNDTDSNYKAYLAALLLAKAQQSKVTIYSTLQGQYCHIGYIAVR